MSFALYRDFASIEELDAQYNLDDNVPDFPKYIESYISRSAMARETLDCSLDVPFGPTVEEHLDIFRAETQGGPAMVFIHGGYWRITSSKEWSFLADGPVAAGYSTFVTNYALCPMVTIGEIVRQHRAAIAWIYRNAEELGIDRQRIIVTGHSAGGHAVAEVLATDWQADYGLPADVVKAGVAISGVFDLRPLPNTFLAPWLQLNQTDVARLSPQLNIPRSIPPLAVMYGSQETQEFRRQSIDYHDSCKEAGLDVELMALPRHHFDILDDLADNQGPIFRAVDKLAS